MANGNGGAGKSFTQAIRETFSGFSECWDLGPQCTVDWSAWGTWAGAAATFFAVLLPYLAARRAARLRAQLAIGDFIRELNQVYAQVITADRVLKNPLDLPLRDAIQMLRIQAFMPALEADPSIRRTLLEIRSLSHQIENWNLSVDLLAVGNPEFLLEGVWPMNNAQAQLRKTSGAVTAVARAIVAELPELTGAVGSLVDYSP